MNAVSSQVKQRPSVTEVFSAQESALVLGKRAVHENVSERALRLFERVRNAGQQPRVALERAAHFTESFKQTEGHPLVLRWAKALLHTTQNISVHIFDDELIVGRPNSWVGKHGIIYPELDGSLMLDAVEAFREARAAMITGEALAVDGGVLSGYGEDLRPIIRKRMADLQAEGH